MELQRHHSAFGTPSNTEVLLRQVLYFRGAVGPDYLFMVVNVQLRRRVEVPDKLARDDVEHVT